MRSVLGKAIILGLALSATAIGGCSSGSKPPTGGGPTTGNTGDIGLQLQVGSLTVNQVAYNISNGTNTYSGTLEVADASHLLAVIGGIQAGTGYTLTLSATATDGTPCNGSSAPFTVVANSTVIVGIQLLCRPSQEAGSVKIEGTVGQCASFGSVGAAVPNGNQIQISVTSVPASPTPPATYAWTGGSPGGLSASNIANPIYTCNGTENQVDLDVTLTQAGAAACTSVFHLIINCPVTGSGTGGTGGATGGTGGATGGTGGATGGTGGATGGTGGATGGTGGTTGGTGGTAGMDAGGCGPNNTDDDCRACVLNNGGPAVADGCETLTGVAVAGAGAGTSLRNLCREAVACFHQSNCHTGAVTDCYCGTTIDLGTCNNTTQGSGACKEVLERALEVAPGGTGAVPLMRITDIVWAGGMAGQLATYENTACPTECLPYTPTSCIPLPP